MRWGLVAVVLWMVGCESRYGAYFVIEGDASFDEVEMYFGKPADTSGTAGSKFASPMLGAQSGVVFDRRFDAADLYSVGARTQTTYYLPPDATNEKLGAYVVAVALANGQPVGIAEYFDFAVPTDAVHEYRLKLEPYGQQRVDRWGERPGCIAWKRARNGSDSIVAVVRDDDRDCDALHLDADCDDLCTAGAATCNAGETFCNSQSFCAVGCVRSGLCAPTLCVPPITCGGLCAALGTFDRRLECGTLKNPDPHFEIFVDRTEPEHQLCVDTFVIAPGVPCTMPIVEVTDPAAVGSFAYTVAQDSDPMQCVLTVSQSATAMLGDFENHHMLISLASATPGLRRTFIIGVQATNNVGCTATPYVFQPAGDAIFDCGLP